MNLPPEQNDSAIACQPNRRRHKVLWSLNVNKRRSFESYLELPIGREQFTVSVSPVL
jgi:hypothetical protein